MQKTITIRGEKYPRPHIDRMKRKQAKKLKPVLAKVQAEDLDALWEVVGILLPGLPAKVLDDLDVGECKQIMTTSGVAQFNAPADEDEADITVGESGASTGS